MRVALVLALAASVGCLPAPEHRCAANHDCTGGVCVSPPGACAFVDGECAGGLRFADGAGALAGTCVATLDAGVLPDARVVTPDEDGDGVADTLDNCPHVHNPLQQDTTENGGPDGVGNICDPEPGRDNRLVLFDGFNGALSPSWTAANGVASMDGHLRLAPGAHVLTSQNHPRHVVVVIGARGDGGEDAVQLAIGAGVQASVEGLFCRQVDSDGGRLQLAYADAVVADTASPPIAADAPFTATLIASASEWSCDLDVRGAAPVALRDSPRMALRAGWIGLATGGVALDVAYITVIALAEQ